METRHWLAKQFEAERPRLRAMAYRMLGSPTEAEEAFHTLTRTDAGTAEAI